MLKVQLLLLKWHIYLHVFPKPFHTTDMVLPTSHTTYVSVFPCVLDICLKNKIYINFLGVFLFFLFFLCVNLNFFYRQHIHHITCTEQDKNIISVNDSYCYVCAQYIATFFLKSIIIVITTLIPPNHYIFINI